MIFKTWHSSSVWHFRRPNRIPIWTGQGNGHHAAWRQTCQALESRSSRQDRPYVVLQYLRTSNVQPCRSQTERRGIGIRGVHIESSRYALFPFWFLTSLDWLKLQHTFPFCMRSVYSMYDDLKSQHWEQNVLRSVYVVLSPVLDLLPIIYPIIRYEKTKPAIHHRQGADFASMSVTRSHYVCTRVCHTVQRNPRTKNP